NAPEMTITNRRMFYAYASRTMHSVIIDYLRERGAQKRGGDQIALTLSGSMPEAAFTEMPVSEVAQALRELQGIDERAFRVVEMSYFGGMSKQDIADVLDVSLATVTRDWRKARTFLLDVLRRA